MKTLSVKLPESLVEWLEAEAALTKQSRSELVREALMAKRSGGVASTEPKPLNMADALDALGGTFRGPKDLSTNPKHLEGFGE